MESRIKDLLKAVGEEVCIYRELVEHARRKTALLVQGSLAGILESNREDEAYNLRLRMLESQIIRLCNDLCAEFRIPREGFTLLRLAEGLGEQVAAEIKSQTSLFRNLVHELEVVNQRNIRLIESSVRYSRGLLDFLANATTSYQSSGMFRPVPVFSTTLSRQA
jgi:FlgN protein